MRDFYQTLGVKPSSSQREIKRAFRERAKRLHPDVHGGEDSDSTEMLALLEAYQTLSVPELRQEYDRRFRQVFARYSFDYREFLKARGSDPESQAKLIFYDLLHGWEDEALELYESLCTQAGFVLERFLDREDAMDCAFLLGEEHEKRRHYLRAFKLYRSCIRMEQRKPYFRNFYPEIIMRAKELLRVRLPSIVGNEDLLECIDAMLELGLPKKENAKYYRQKAEINLRLGRQAAARADLESALALDRKMSGVEHLKKWLGIE